MIFVGPISSIFDVGTFLLMWYIFGANAPAHQALFQVVHRVAATQTLIVHMIRTAKVPFLQSRAAWPVLLLTAGDPMGCGVLLPFIPLATKLKLQPLPGSYSPGSLVILLSYSVLTQIVKGWYLPRFGSWL